MKPYKQPSIVGVFGTLGVISFILGTGTILYGLHHKQQECLIAGAGSLFSGLFLVACASALDYLARGAHWAEQSHWLQLRIAASENLQHHSTR